MEKRWGWGGIQGHGERRRRWGGGGGDGGEWREVKRGQKEGKGRW